MAPSGNCVYVHEKPKNHMSWGCHGTPGWYIGPSLEHYISVQCYVTTTGIVCITDTLKYIPKSFDLIKTKTEDYLRQAIGNILAITQDPPKTLHLLSYGYETNNAISQITHSLKRVKSRPCLTILPLLSMLLQSQTPNPAPIIISYPDAPAPRVEPTFQPTRMQPYMKARKSLLRVQHAPTSILDPITNPWIKKLIRGRIIP